VLPLFERRRRRGHVLGPGYIDFDGYVLMLTAPGRARMPNGVECHARLDPGSPAWIGGGVLQACGWSVLPGPGWDPVPSARVRLAIQPHITPDPARLAGRGGGLTPAGDDLLAGYAAGLVLFHGCLAEAEAIARAAAARTTSLSATLLRHAARGELPEPAHALLEHGDPAPLRSFGHSSGRALMVGLALAC
jgi:hypothetical protein